MTAFRVGVAGLAIVAAAVAAACSTFESADAPSDPDASADASPTNDVANDAALADASTDGSTSQGPRVYIFGGHADNPGLVVVHESYSATINADGSLGTWERAPLLDTAAYLAATAVTPSGRIVNAGGHRGTADAAAPTQYNSKGVVTAALDPPSAFVTDAPLPNGSGYGAAAAVGDVIVYGGGQKTDSQNRNEVYATSFDTNGVLAPWSQSVSLPKPLAAHRFVTIGSRLYAIGGVTDGDDASVLIVQNSTYVTSVSANGALGTWAKTADMPGSLWGHTAVVAGGRIYVMGGRFGSGGMSAAVYVGTPDANGELTWVSAQSLPKARFNACAVAAKDVIYVFGGTESANSTPVTTVFAGRLGAAGGVSWSEVTALPGPRSAMGCATR